MKNYGNFKKDVNTKLPTKFGYKPYMVGGGLVDIYITI